MQFINKLIDYLIPILFNLDTTGIREGNDILISSASNGHIVSKGLKKMETRK